MHNKTEINICLGSSCFSRGNKENIQLVNDFIKENQLENKVHFHGSHCLGGCSKGPNIRIGETTYENINPANLQDLLKKTLKKHL